MLLLLSINVAFVNYSLWKGGNHHLFDSFIVFFYSFIGPVRRNIWWEIVKMVQISKFSFFETFKFLRSFDLYPNISHIFVGDKINISWFRRKRGRVALLEEKSNKTRVWGVTLVNACSCSVFKHLRECIVTGAVYEKWLICRIINCWQKKRCWV